VLTLNGRQTLQGTLATDALDLTPYISTVRLLTGGEHGWDSKVITLHGLDGMDVDLRLSAARVTIANAKLGRTAVTATLHGGRITVAIGESEAFGGVVKGTMAIAKSSPGTGVKAQLQFANVDRSMSRSAPPGLEGKGPRLRHRERRRKRLRVDQG
jgi:AsmA protein